MIPSTPDVPTPPSVFEGRHDFQRALMGLMAEAEHARAHRLWWIDPDFSAWPLGDPAFLAALTVFVKRPGRQVVVLTHSDAAWARRHVRFQAWRQTWGHTLKLLQPESPHAVLPTWAFLDKVVAVRVNDTDHWRGRLEREVTALSALAESVQALVQGASEAFPLRPLGL